MQVEMEKNVSKTKKSKFKKGIVNYILCIKHCKTVVNDIDININKLYRK